jgi:hypothetical protein
VHLLAASIEIRDTWLRFSSLEILSSKDGLPETQKKLLLVSKIVDKNKKPGQEGESESEDGGGTKHKTAGTALFVDLRLL